ncbi:hypothetical protein AMTRI_Chr03g54400 [Amborella trichopoda]
MPTLSKAQQNSVFKLNQPWKWQRLLLISFLFTSVFAPILFLSDKLTYFTSSSEHKEFLDDISSVVSLDHPLKRGSDSGKLNAIQQETGENVKEPRRFVFRDGEDKPPARVIGSTGSKNARSHGNHGKHQSRLEQLIPLQEVQSKHQLGEKSVRSRTHKPTEEKVLQMRDQVIRAKAYLNFAAPRSNSHLAKELRLRIRESERSLGDAIKDSDLHRSASQRMRSMEAVLTKAGRVYNDCGAMATKLRAMTHNAEEQVAAHKKQAEHLSQLAATTFPKGLHCLTMRLTTDFFELQSDKRGITDTSKLKRADLYHYVIFSDNVLACSVVVNSTVSSSLAPEKLVIHVVTDMLNYPAMTTWFRSNPPGQAALEVLNMDELTWLDPSRGFPSNQPSDSLTPKFRNPKYINPLNHARFYIPEIFPALDKVVHLDHDVVVQRDLSLLWSMDMKGMVNGAVHECSRGGLEHTLDAFLNFSDPVVVSRLDAKACAWGFGVNMFDLREWRQRKLTNVYHEWLEMGKGRQLWKLGSLPVGLATFHGATVRLNGGLMVHGLGYDPLVSRRDIEKAAVLHYDGNMKPWLEIAMAKYRGYWTKFVPYEQPYLQQCNIHP